MSRSGRPRDSEAASPASESRSYPEKEQARENDVGDAMTSHQQLGTQTRELQRGRNRSSQQMTAPIAGRSERGRQSFLKAGLLGYDALSSRMDRLSGAECEWAYVCVRVCACARALCKWRGPGNSIGTGQSGEEEEELC